MQNQTETEADVQTARFVAQRLNEITTRANLASARFWKRYFLWCACFVSISAILIIMLGTGNPLSGFLLFLLCTAPIIALIATDSIRARERPKFTPEELAQLGGIRAIAPLFAILKYPLSAKQQRAIYDALAFLLPQMKASDATLLPSSARSAICLMLELGTDGISMTPCSDELRIAMLQALEQVGDSYALPVVERIAKIKPRTPGQEKIKCAATECLPRLRANCGEVEAARTLLRASQPENTAPDTLLRPASNSGPVGSAELLRGTDAPDAPPSKGQAG